MSNGLKYTCPCNDRDPRNTDLNNIPPELGSQPNEFAMFIQKWTFPR